MEQYTKDPAAELDYQRDWSDWLKDGDTISESAWLVPSGLMLEDQDHDTTSATVWLSGGTLDEEYLVTNEVVTAGGRTDRRSILVTVQKR